MIRKLATFHSGRLCGPESGPELGALSTKIAYLAVSCMAVISMCESYLLATCALPCFLLTDDMSDRWSGFSYH
jgi:hypothetical protein